MALQTILVYIFLTIILYLGSSYTVKKNTNVFYIASILVYAIILGLRSGVGVDFWGYKKWYEDALVGIDSYSHIEWGFRAIMETCASMNLPVSFFFGLIAFLQLLLIYLSLKRHRDTYPYLALIFMLGAIWLTYANGLRQQLAFCVFAYSIQFIADRKWIKHYICMLVAISLHTSAIVLLPIYLLYIRKDELFHNIKFQYLALIVVFIISSSDLINNIAIAVEPLAEFLDYDAYFNKKYEIANDIKIGLGYWINLAVPLFLIYLSNQVKQYYNSRLVSIIYDMTYIGVLLKYLLFNSLIFSRLNYYFGGFEYIFAALSLAYLRRFQDIRKIILLLLFIAIFMATLYRMNTNTALFLFNWQTNLY